MLRTLENFNVEIYLIELKVVIPQRNYYFYSCIFSTDLSLYLLFSSVVKDFLANEFGLDRVWSLGFLNECSPRSPYLNSFDFCINNEFKGKA